MTSQAHVHDVVRRLRALDPDRRAMVFAQLAARGEEFNVHPVSPGQRRLWLLDQLHPGHPVYNVPYAFRLRGRCDADALARALRLVGARHEALRTVFLDIHGEPRQMILPEPQAELVVTDDPIPVDDRDAVARARAGTEARTAFDLTEGPLLRAELVRFDDTDALLLVTLHHIICDGWSTRLLFAELRRAYQGLDLGPEPLQYVDYTRWQGEWLRGETSSGLLDYWTAQLAGAPPTLELLTDHPRPAVLGMRGDLEAFTWPPQLARRLDEFCRSEQLTPFLVLLTAWNVLLHRYCGQDDLVVATNVANRGREETERAIGFYVNTLAVRTGVDPQASFRTLLHQVRDTTLAAQAHQDLPFETVVDALRPPRSTAHHPVVQTLVGMEDTETDIADLLALPGLSVERVASHSGTAKWDLELAVTSVMTATSGEITGWLEYDSALYERDTVRRLLEHLHRLLSCALADPELPVARLSLLTDAEHEQVVRDWNRPTQLRCPGRLVHELVEDSAERTPEALALVFESQELSYRQLDERANQLAHQLRTHGVGRETLVGICLPRSLDLVVAMQAVLKSGGAYVPLDPQHPADRLAFMVRDAGTRLVITVSELAELLPTETPKLLLDHDSARIAALPTSRPQRINEPDDLAYVIYTSGSTGRPKGVMVPHRGVCNVVAELVRMTGATPRDRVLQFASFGFDVSVADIMLALHAGATAVLAARHDLQPGPDLARTIRHQRVTIAGLPPTVLRLTDPADVPGLARLMAGGEACPEEIAAAWAPGRSFINIYGPTETSIWVTATRCNGTESPVPIGRPVAGNECYVLDRNLEPVPVGVPGELCVGGVGVCRGYLGRPELTADRFVPDAFSGRPGARLYRTGDLVRWRPDGRLEFLHRMDDQVKVRGYRIEPGEIQAVIGQHDSVRAAVVTTREDVPGDVRLIAYVVAADGHRIDPAVLRVHLRRSLPEYMVPAAFVPVGTIPRTPNGKLDHRALPAPESVRDPRAERPVVAAGTRLERTIAGIWREVLRVDRLGADDNFFDLGGNSLLLAKVRSRLSEALGREVPAMTLFTFPTVHALAAHFEGAQPQAGRDLSDGRDLAPERDLAQGRRALLARRVRRERV